MPGYDTANAPFATTPARAVTPRGPRHALTGGRIGSGGDGGGGGDGVGGIDPEGDGVGSGGGGGDEEREAASSFRREHRTECDCKWCRGGGGSVRCGACQVEPG